MPRSSDMLQLNSATSEKRIRPNLSSLLTAAVDARFSFTIRRSLVV